MRWLPVWAEALVLMASTSLPAHVKLPAVPKISCSSSESRERFQLLTQAGRWERGPYFCVRKALVPLRVDEKHTAGVKDLPCGLNTAVCEVH